MCTAKAEDAEETPTRSHVSPSILAKKKTDYTVGVSTLNLVKMSVSTTCSYRVIVDYCPRNRSTDLINAHRAVSWQSRFFAVLSSGRVACGESHHFESKKSTFCLRVAMLTRTDWEPSTVWLHRGTSLTRKHTPLEPYRRPMPRVLRGS
jgi:hypothetical protein